MQKIKFEYDATHILSFNTRLHLLKIKPMKRVLFIFGISGAIAFAGCNSGTSNTENATQTAGTETAMTGQSGVQDEVSNPNVVQIAVGSKDHTTLVKAVQAAKLVDALSNAGPFTVFAPVNAAFDKLPAGTVEDLLKPEKLEALVDVLEYHVYVGVLRPEMLQDGMVLNQVNGKNVTISNKDGKAMVNNANIVASIPAANGIIHVIDAVLVPAAK